jgi:hypothetical protein
MKKEPFSQHLLSFWYVYGIYAALAFVVVDFSLLAIKRVPTSQKLVFFIGADASDSTALQNHLEEQKPNGIKELDVYTYAENLSSFGEMYTLHGGGEADLLILSLSKAKQYSSSLLSFDPLTYPLKGLEGYNQNGVSGYLVQKADGSGSFLSSYLAYLSGQDYVLSFRKGSTHLGNYNSSSDEAAILLLKGLLNG